MPSTRAHAEIWRGKRLHQWYYTVYFGNGEEDTSRKTYVTKWNAKRAAIKRTGLPKDRVQYR